MKYSCDGLNLKPVLLGIFALLVGLLFYLVERPAWQIGVIPPEFSLYEVTPDVFGKFGDSFPTFIHVFSFSLITAGIIGGSRTTLRSVCGIWGCINLLFELAHAPGTYGWFDLEVGAWSGGSVTGGWFRAYLQNGVFDVFDLLSIVVGSLCAYGVLLTTFTEGG